MKRYKKENIFRKLLIDNLIFLLLEIAGSLIVTECLLVGNKKISLAIDKMISGQLDNYINNTFWVEMTVLIILGFLFAIIQNISMRKFAVNILTGFRKKAGRYLLEIQYRYFDSHTSAQVLNNFISDTQKVSEYYSEVLPCLITGSVSIAAILTSIIRIDALLTFCLIIIVPVMIMISRYANKKVAKLTKIHWKYTDEVGETVYDGLQGINVIRGFCLESLFIKKVKEINDKRLKYEYKRNRISAISWFLSTVVTFMPGIILGIIAFYRVRDGYISAGQMTYFMLLLDRIIHPLGQSPTYLIEAKEDLVSRARLEQIMHFKSEHKGNVDFNINSENIITFDDVDFSYDNVNKVLSKCSFNIKKGENIAFVGESGGGKSTIFKLICGLYEPDNGSISIMGSNIESVDLNELRKHIAIVSQNVFLFPESIEWNVRCGMENVTSQQVMEACKKARIHDFIMTLPNGYNTNVGERGDLLSGGQKQRISIARAMLKNADIILFDEPTASVDVENEDYIKMALNEIAKGKTVITIAHRLNTIKDADRIYTVKNGNVITCEKEALS